MTGRSLADLGLDRNQRRAILATEARARASGDWGNLGYLNVAEARANGQLQAQSLIGWTAEVHTSIKTLPEWLVVLVRTAQTIWGPVDHLIIRTASGTELKWREKQRLKNMLAGPDRVAVEVMPAQERVVDQADLFHLWVLPEGMSLPFGIHRDDPASGVHVRNEG